MHTKLLLRKSGNSHIYRLSCHPLLATVAVSSTAREATPTGRSKPRKMVDAILPAVRKPGYTQCATLAMQLARIEPSPQIAGLAKAACDLIPYDTKKQVIESLHLEIHDHD